MSESLIYPEARRAPLSLYVLGQIAFLKVVHHKASFLETEYISLWKKNQLSYPNRALAETLDIRNEAVDTRAVVERYQIKLREIKQKQTELVRKKLERHQSGPRLMTSKTPNGGIASRTRSKLSSPTPGPSFKAKAEKKTKVSKVNVEKYLNLMAKPLVNGIPGSAEPAEYIEYRKCKYIEDLRVVRDFLVEKLSACQLQDLMDTMYNISLFNHKSENGLLSLQSMLTTRHTRRFSIAPPKFHENFAIQPITSIYSNIRSHPVKAEYMETRIGTTILHFALAQGQNLTHLDLKRCACDSILKVVANTAVHLRHLVISRSMVSDQGLLYLAGVESVTARPKLRRECKQKANESSKLVRDVTPKFWAQGKNCCRNLVHLEAEDLLDVSWPGQAVMKYFDYPSVPLDSGFVAVLMYLPHLKVFLCEVGARAVQSYSRNYVKWHKRAPKLRLEAISDSHLTPPVFDVVQDLCPNLSHLKVEWFESYTTQIHNREDWLAGLVNVPKLAELRIGDVDFKTEKLKTFLPNFGPNLTHLELKEIWKFKYSNLRAIKQWCPNLKFFSLVMTTKNVLATVSRVQVDKDHNIQLNSNEKHFLTNLEDFHLSGPFGYEVVQYLLMQAEKIKSLSLGIEWLDPAFCDNQPLTRKDLIGREYLEEILSVNPLPNLEQLHLMAQYRRGRKRLNRFCLDFILSKFPKLKHLGSFFHWNLSLFEIREIMDQLRFSNVGLILEEDLQSTANEPKFEYKYVAERKSLSCGHVPPKRDAPGMLASFLDVMVGPPNLLDDDISSSDESSMDSDLDDDNLMEEVGVPDDLEDDLDDNDLGAELMINDPQVCHIM